MSLTKISEQRGLRQTVLVSLVLALAFSAGWAFSVRGEPVGTTYYACLYGGSLSQVGTTEPANCGRGSKISWNSESEPDPNAVSGIEQLSTPHSIEAGGASANFDNYAAFCPDGKVAIAGGFQPSAAAVEIMSSFPSDNGNRWLVRARNTAPSATRDLTVFVTCIDGPVEPPI